MSAKYQPDKADMAKWLQSDAGLQAAMTGVAEQGADFARSIAPVQSGEYAASFHVSEESQRKGAVGATIYNDAPHAAAVEYSGHGTLARTADDLGGKRRRG